MAILIFVICFIAIFIGLIGMIGYSEKYFEKLVKKTYDEYARDLYAISSLVFLIGVLGVIGVIISNLIFR